MTPKYRNALLYYTMEFADTPEMAQVMANTFEEKFKLLDKYSQLSMSLIIENDGFETAFDLIDKI